MNLNPYASEKENRNAELADAETYLRRSREALEDYDTNGTISFQERELADTRTRTMDLERELVSARERRTQSEQALTYFDAVPRSTPKSSTWKYVLAGAGILALAGTGLGVLAPLVVALDFGLGVGAVVGAGAGAVVGGGLGAATSKEADKENAKTARSAWGATRKKLADDLDKICAQVTSLEAALERAKKQADSLTLMISEAHARRDTTVREDLEADIVRRTQIRDECALLQNAAEAQYRSLQVKIARYVDRIDELDDQLTRLQHDLEAAQSFERRLNEAAKSDKKFIHIDCGRHFQNQFPDYVVERPGKILKALHGQVDPLTRVRDKLLVEVANVVRIHQLRIARVVIDGNNMCYLTAASRGRNPFIGLSALTAACAGLRAEGLEILVVFDPSIPQLLKCPHGQTVTSWIESQIGSDVSVFVAPKGTRADEYVLREAADPHSAAVSNDRFQEAQLYLDRYPAVAEKRVFPHHITAPRGEEQGHAEIQAFGVSMPWK